MPTDREIAEAERNRYRDDPEGARRDRDARSQGAANDAADQRRDNPGGSGYGSSEEARQAGGQDNTEVYSWIEETDDGPVQRWGYRNPDNTGRDIERGFADAGQGILDFFTDSDDKRAAQEAEEWRIGQWQGLEDRAPTLDELTADYRGEGRTDAYGNLLGGPSRLEGMTQENQQAALDAMGGLMEGGLTEADKAAIHAQRLQSGQRLGAANQAAIQQMSARGMGGSGAELASRMGGSQAMANANAMGDASVLGQASNRAFAAMQGYGQLSGQMFDQESRRRANLDSWNQQGLDWRRGRESRNTDIYNQGQDQRVGAHQQQFENDTTTTGGKTNQNFQNIQHQQGREDEEEDRLWRIGAAIVD